jgi:hypothetical protein
MTIRGIAWYLCVLFSVALAGESVVTVAPGGEMMNRILLSATGGLVVLFAAVAVSFSTFRLSQPPWLVRTFQGFAVLATLAVLMMIWG